MNLAHASIWIWLLGAPLILEIIELMRTPRPLR